MMTLAAVLCCTMTTIVLTSCTNDGKVFEYTYEGNTLYYVIDDTTQQAMLVPPLYPNCLLNENYSIDGWQGYEQPKGNVTIPETVEYGGKRYSVTVLEKGAFSLCNDITSVTLPEGLTTIGNSAFRECRNLSNITFPSTLTTIGEFAFQYAEKIGPDIILPEGLTSIGYAAFGDCYSMESITLPSTLQSIDDAVLAACKKLHNVTFPDHLTHLGGLLVQFCDSLTTCHLPAQLEYIENDFFCHTAISHLDIPEHVTGIGKNAFQACLSLKELSLPASVKELADSVFSDGTVLKTLSLASPVPPTITETTFEDYTTVVTVPKGARNAYRSHDIWGRFANITEKK